MKNKTHSFLRTIANVLLAVVAVVGIPYLYTALLESPIMLTVFYYTGLSFTLVPFISYLVVFIPAFVLNSIILRSRYARYQDRYSNFEHFFEERCRTSYLWIGDLLLEVRRETNVFPMVIALVGAPIVLLYVYIRLTFWVFIQILKMIKSIGKFLGGIGWNTLVLMGLVRSEIIEL